MLPSSVPKHVARLNGWYVSSDQGGEIEKNQETKHALSATPLLLYPGYIFSTAIGKRLACLCRSGGSEDGSQEEKRQQQPKVLKAARYIIILYPGYMLSTEVS